jgi:hypothetical protein
MAYDLIKRTTTSSDFAISLPPLPPVNGRTKLLLAAMAIAAIRGIAMEVRRDQEKSAYRRAFYDPRLKATQEVPVVPMAELMAEGTNE